VGVATQRSELRARFTGKPEHLVNYMRFLAQDLREHMAQMGFRTVDEMIGHTDYLRFERAIDHWKTTGLDLENLLLPPDMPEQPLRCMREEWRDGITCLDDELIEKCQSAIKNREPVKLDLKAKNTQRTVGARLSGELVRNQGRDGLPDDTIQLNFTGYMGQSLGAFLAPGITIRLTGEANDYVGKGLNGGKIIVHPSEKATYVPHENVVAGNVILYGAITGELYINGQAGERFAIRNSGAKAVVEGVGDHGCEYMTGGVVVVLGDTGYNFAAGMSGGIAYVYDEAGLFDTKCNLDMVDVESVWSGEDKNELRTLIEKHLEYTGSERAKFMLDHWDTQVRNFVKVMPIEYRRVLERMKEQQDRESETVSATEEVFD
jgi:glutamate synthase domain-containing protein 3